MARKKLNKSESIRNYLKSNPAAGPSHVVAELKKKGITVSIALVSKVKRNEQAPKAASRLGQKKSQTASRNGRKPGPRSASELVAIDALIEARAFANKVGGVDKAAHLLKTLAKIG